MVNEKLMQNIADNFDFAELFRETTRNVTRQLEEKITGETLKGITNFYLTGCGDSLFEAFAAANIFEKYTGLRTEAIEALEFSKYRAGFVQPGTMVFCISNSGGASRTIETVQSANAAGAFTVAVSGNDKSVLAQEARLLIHRPVPQFPGVLGNCGRVVRNMAEYVLSLHVLYLVGLHIAVVLGKLSGEERDRLVSLLLEQPANILKTARACAKPICEYVEKYRDEQAFFFLGAGPNYATALFGSAKLHEDVPVNGVGEWMEEWCHLQYFLSLNEEHKSHLCLIAAPGKSRNRAAEIAASARSMDVPVLELRSEGDSSPVLDGVVTLPVCDGGVPEMFSPMVYCTPLQLLGIYWALERGAESVPLSRADDYKLIRGSAIEVDYMK